MFRSFSLILFLFFLNIRFLFADESTYYITDKFGLGRMFDGVGGLSAGASSKLLRGYPEQQRNEILDYLFKPNFGGALQILKVEIGGDAESTDGTESTHMRTPDEENYQRGYEWWLMTEAKKRNPDILLYGLPWGWPGWVGGKTGNVYGNPEQTAWYIVNWISGAKSHYNLSMDYIGIWNEKMYNTTYIKTLRKALDRKGFQGTKIIAADYFGWDLLATEIINDPDLARAIYAMGVHYPGTESSMKALESGKQLWSSEDYSTFDNLVGGGCWARLLNRNYVHGFMSSTISWALIASWYQGLPYYGDGLMTAIEPWSGHYEVNSPIWMTAHTTQFTKVGWKYLSHGWVVGELGGGGSYVALVSPDGKDLTIIVETMSHDHSVCIRPPLPPYSVSPQNITFVFNGSFTGIQSFYPWFSQLTFKEEAVFFQKSAPIQVKNNRITFSMGVDQIVTLTTLTTGNKGYYSPPPPSKSFPLPFSADFEDYSENEEPSEFSQQLGSFEVHDVGSPHGHIMRQMTLQKPVQWCGGYFIGMAMTIVGSPNWTDIYVQADLQINPTNGSNGVFIAARINQTGCQSNRAMGVFFFLYPDQQIYVLSASLDLLHVLERGKVQSVKDWNTVSLLVNGQSAFGSVNGQTVFNYTVLPRTIQSGFVAMGTGSLGHANFDNVKLTTAQDGHHYVKKYKNDL